MPADSNAIRTRSPPLFALNPRVGFGFPRAYQPSTGSFEARVRSGRSPRRGFPPSDPLPACAGGEFIHLALLPYDVAEFGLTDDDREQMGRYLSKSYLDRTPEDLRPADEEEE